MLERENTLPVENSEDDPENPPHPLPPVNPAAVNPEDDFNEDPEENLDLLYEAMAEQNPGDVGGNQQNIISRVLMADSV